ncbi:MAG: sulfate permease [Bacteroidota bacterium]
MYRRQAWFPRPLRYEDGGFRREWLGGVTVGVLLVPQAMAYALLAGVDPIYGLYASLVPLLVYSLFSSCPQVSVGPTALASLVTLGALAGLAEPFTPQYLMLAIALAGLTGLIQLLFGLFKFGVIVTLLSRPVISGFVSAAAVLIMLSQLKTLFGIDMPRASYLIGTLQNFFNHLSGIHWITAAISAGSLAFLLLLRRFLPRWPGTLLLVALATFFSFLFNWEALGVQLVGDLPRGLPQFVLPQIDAFPQTTEIPGSIQGTEGDVLGRSVWITLLPAALILAMLSFVETVSIAKTYEERHAYYRARPNRELIALGLSKLAGSFFQAIPTSASFSRSAVAHRQGVTTFRAHLLTLVVVVLALFVLTDLFAHLPLASLSVIIVLSVEKLFNLAEIKRLWHLDRKDWFSLIVTLVLTLLGGLQLGIGAGVLVSLGRVMMRSARPHLAELGCLPGTTEYRNVKRYDRLLIDPNILVVRFDAELFFGNADYFRDELEKLIEKRSPAPKAVVIDAHTINDLDSTGIYVLEQLHERLLSDNIALYFCGAIGPVRDQLFASGLMDRFGRDHYFNTVQRAVSKINGDLPDAGDRPALQHS